MGLGGFIAGRYSNVYNAQDVGIAERGIELQQDSRWDEISQSDAYGDSLLDGIYRGGTAFFQYSLLQFGLGGLSGTALAAFWPWASKLGVMQTVGSGANPTPVGRRASDVALSSVFTSTAGTPAATQDFTTGQSPIGGPNAITAAKTILAPNSPATLALNTRLRQLPVRLVCLPQDTTVGFAANITGTVWFTSA
jgi:hypothetical protein